MTARKKRAVRKPVAAAKPVEVPVVVEAEEPVRPSTPARGMTTEQIRRVGIRIAEHEKDLKSSTSRR